MKRKSAWLAALMMVLLMLCGAASAQEAAAAIELKGYTPGGEFEYVELGYYPFTSGGLPQPVLWRVLSVSDDVALLRTEYAIDVVEGDKNISEGEIMDGIYWDLLGSYTEVGSVLTGSIPTEFDLNSDFYGYSTDGVSGSRKVKATPYAASRGVQLEKGYAGYWANRSGRISGVTPNGGLISIKRPMKLGVVPMITASVSQLRLNQGSGTMGDPYRSTFSARDLWFERNMRMPLYEIKQRFYNPYRKKIPVYTGPGEEYYLPEDNILHWQDDSIKILAREDGWLLIEYLVSGKKKNEPAGRFYRTGYVDYKLILKEEDEIWYYWPDTLPHKSIPALITEEAMLYEDRNLMGQPLYVFEMGRDVTLLGYTEHNDILLAYVEAEIYDQKARGFVRLDQIEPEGYDIGFLTGK